jgi:hypothetical protein
MQALLRLKLLQRGVAANNLLQKSTSSEVNKQVQPQGSAIMQLRFVNFYRYVNFLIPFVVDTILSWTSFVIARSLIVRGLTFVYFSGLTFIIINK